MAPGVWTITEFVFPPIDPLSPNVGKLSAREEAVVLRNLLLRKHLAHHKMEFISAYCFNLNGLNQDGLRSTH